MSNGKILFIAKDIVILTIPYASSHILFALSEQIDNYLLSMSGPKVFAASEIYSLSLPIMGIFNMPLCALAPIVSQLNGSNKKKSIASIIQQGWIVGTFLCLPQAIIMALNKPLLKILNQPNDLSRLAETGFYINILSLPAISWLSASMGYVYGMGKKLPILCFNVFNLTSRAILNYGLIHGKFGLPKLNLNGHALAVTIQSWLNYSAFTIYLKVSGNRHGYNFFTFDFFNFTRLFKRFIKLGFFMAAENLALTISVILKDLLIASYGEKSINAVQITDSYSNFNYFINTSIAQAICILISNAIGEKDYALARKYVRVGAVLGLASSLLLSVPCFTMPQYITEIFIKDIKHKDELLTNRIFYISGVQSITSSISYVLSGAFWGIEDSFTPALITSLTFLFVTLPVVLSFYYGTDVGTLGVAIGYFIGSIIHSIITASVCYKKFNNLQSNEITSNNQNSSINNISQNLNISNLGKKLMNFSIFNSCKNKENEVKEENDILVEGQSELNQIRLLS